MQRKGFSLLELLVVVAIIAVLIAIILPSLGAAKERTRRVVCQAQLQQIGIAYHMYADDYDGHFPYVMKANSSGLVVFAQEYIDEPEIFLCPGDRYNTVDKVVTAGLNIDDSVCASYFHSCLLDHLKLSMPYPYRIYVAEDSTGVHMTQDAQAAAYDGPQLPNHKNGKNVLYLDNHVDWVTAGP